MRILGASVYLPDNEPDFLPSYTKPYASRRSRADDEELLVTMALPVCWRVLIEQNLRPQQIDLLISMSVTPDHLVGHKDVAAPRLCHPLQRDLGATNAFVFDLIDADWTTAIEIAEGFMQNQAYSRALIVRAENTGTSILPDEVSGFSMPDGVGVLLITTDDQPARTAYKDIDTKDWHHARLDMLTPEVLCEGKAKCRLQFTYQAGKGEELNQQAIDVAQRAGAESPDVIVAESWIPGQQSLLKTAAGLQPHPTFAHLGPFSLPFYAEQLLLTKRTEEPVELINVTFNPFLMRYASQCLLV